MKEQIEKAIEDYKAAIQKARETSKAFAPDSSQMRFKIKEAQDARETCFGLIDEYAKTEDVPKAERVPVESSNIAAVRYDPEALMLEVTFKDKAGKETETGVLFNVPQERYDEFMKSESKGGYYRKYFYKSEQFPYQKIG